jgi:hypothetical protein
MAKAQIYNEQTGQYEDDPNAPDFAPVDTSQIGAPGTNTGIAAPATQPAQFDRNQFRDASMARPIGQSAADFIASNPSYAGVTSYQGSKDKYVIPGTNEVIDLTINSDAQGRGTGNGWTGLGVNAYGVPDAPAGGGVSQSSVTGGQATQGASNPFQDQIRALLLQQLQGLSQPVDPNDPTIAGQTEAYRNERTRGARTERAALAERAAMQGLLSGGASSGGFDTDLQSINEGASQDVSGFKAQLMGRELENRRASLAQMLNMALQSGDSESARALQLQIAQMDAELRRMGLAQQGSQFNAQLGQQQYEYNDTMGWNQTQADRDEEYRRAVLAAGG